MASKILTKWMGGRVTETKEVQRNGIPVGIIAGHTATWDIDRGGYWEPDQFVKGAFAEAIQRHKDSGNRQVRLTWMHRDLVGGIPIETVFEDDKGLFGEAEVNLETRLGREAYSLAKQGVLVDFSIGFEPITSHMITVEGQDVRQIDKSEYWHSALVDEPMNPEAQVTAVKAYTKDQLEALSTREIEAALVDSGCWSERAAKILASGHGVTRPGEEVSEEDWQQVLEEIQATKEAIRA